MIYSNLDFILFFFVIFALNLVFSKSVFIRQRFLIVASLIFYAWGGIIDTFIFLLIVIFSWLCLWASQRFNHLKKQLLFFGVGVMLLHLFFWKYANWINREIQYFYPQWLGGRAFNIPLPMGISFFTLQGIAYLLDTSRENKRIMPFSEYLLFKSFFPQLLAGPIVRAHQLLPQIKKLRMANFLDIQEGMELFCLGFFKKVALADRMPKFCDDIFRNPSAYGSGAIFLAVLGYSVQIYGDFSGYTDMGRGVAKMLGVELPQNFRSPYFAISPSDFWKRWHITLSEWIRDYIYIPLGGNQGSRLRVLGVVFITMVLSGLWHGAAWTFALWGIYHGLLLVLERVLKENSASKFMGAILSTRVNVGLHRALMFLGVLYGWMIFRSGSFELLLQLNKGLFRFSQGQAFISPLNIMSAFGICILIQGIQLKSSQLKTWIDELQTSWGITFWAIRGMALGLLFCGAFFFRISGDSLNFIYFNF